MHLGKLIHSRSIRPFVRNSVTCKLAFFAGYMGESCSQWFLVALCAERFVALTWPLRVRQLFSSSGCFKAETAVVLVFCVIVCTPVLVVFDEWDPYCFAVLAGYTGRSEDQLSTAIWSTVMAYVTTAQKYGYSTILIITLTALIFVKILLIRKRYRQEISSHQSGSTKKGNN